MVLSEEKRAYNAKGLRALSRAFLIVGGISVVLAIPWAGCSVLLGIADSPPPPGQEWQIPVAMVVGILLGMLLPLMQILSGVWILRHRHWMLVMVVVVATIALQFPFGIGLGLPSVLILSDPAVRAMFERRPVGAAMTPSV